ncbi:MAG: serine/threonine protein phosphatase, partial [Acutalibacteraceae bacterium]
FIHNNSVQAENYCICGKRGWIYDSNKLTENDKKIIRREAGRLEASIKSAGDYNAEKIVFLHYPPVFDASRCDEIMDVLHKNNIKRVYYGHIHGEAHKLAVNGICEDIEFRLVSCDYTEFCPVLIR